MLERSMVEQMEVLEGSKLITIVIRSPYSSIIQPTHHDLDR